MTFERTGQTTERLLPGEGEERVRRALEDGVIARERDVERRAGWSIADLARDLGISETRAAKMVRLGGGVNLRAGQIPMLRPRIRAAVLAAINAGVHEHRPIERRVRKLSALVGRLNDTVDRALADHVIDNAESAELRAAFREIADASAEAAEDVEAEGSA